MDKSDLELMKSIQNRINTEKNDHELKSTPQQESLTKFMNNNWYFKFSTFLATIPGIIGSIATGMVFLSSITGCIFTTCCIYKEYLFISRMLKGSAKKLPLVANPIVVED